MEKLLISCVLVTFLMLFNTPQSMATNPVAQNTITDFNREVGEIHDDNIFKELLKTSREKVEIIKAKVRSKFYKIAGMFNDPVRKWMWFWLIAGILGILLLFLSVIVAFGGSSIGFYLLFYGGWALTLFSGVSFVIWIVKLIQG